jgi:uncharacterized RDD family membrane protein YckC
MKILIKGIIFYITTIATMLYVMIIDSLGYFATIGGFAILVALILFCANTISKKEYEIITFAKYFKE